MHPPESKYTDAPGILISGRVPSQNPEHICITEGVPSSSKRPAIRTMIELQRRLIRSRNPFIRHIGSLIAAGALNGRLNELLDNQIAQLLSDELERDLEIAAPEGVICHQATKRLFRSKLGSLEGAKSTSLLCPKCGSEMLKIVGIDEASSFQCVLLSCGFTKSASEELEDGNERGHS